MKKILIERYFVLTKIKEYFVESFGNHVNIRADVNDQIIQIILWDFILTSIS